MNQSNVLAEALREAEKTLPEGTIGRDLTSIYDDSLRFDFITKYEPELACGRPPVLQSPASFGYSGPFNEDKAEKLRHAVMRTAEQHREEWTFIHGPEYAAAAAKWRAAQAV